MAVIWCFPAMKMNLRQWSSCKETVSYTHLDVYKRQDYRNGKTKGVNMGLGVENSVKSGRESDLSGLRKRYLGNFSI